MIRSKSGRTPKVKTRLRQAALRLFSERGIDDTPVKDIVRAAHTTQPMLYYYYGSKDNLCIELFREISEEVSDGASRIMSRNCPLNTKLEALFIFYRRYFGRNPGIARFILLSALSMRHGKDIKAVADKAQGVTQKALQRMMESHAASGELDPKRAAAATELVNALVLYFILSKNSQVGISGMAGIPRGMADIICKGSK
jgi:AcrR family transcriptional regulator